MAADSLERMERLLAAWEDEGDRRAVFLDCYARMTRAMREALARGEFGDPDWVAGLLDRFAVYYFDSVDTWEHDRDRTPGPWRVAHGAATSDASAAQLLLAGVNAHINFDLVLTLVDVLGPDWPRGDDQLVAMRRADYDTVNRVIAATADEVQDGVLERWTPTLDVADRLLGRGDEWLAVRLLRSWRDEVWEHATRVLDREPDARLASYERRAARCERRGRWIVLHV